MLPDPTQGGPQQASLATEHRNEDQNAGADTSAFGEGRFQLRVLLSVVVAGAISLVHSSIFRLSTREMDHWCMRAPAYSELSVESWKQLAIPRDADGNYSRCKVRNPPYGGPSAQVVPCSEWEFNLSEYGNNVVSEWSLVCQRSHLKDIATLVNFVATVFALPVIGAAADRIGRKTITVVQLVALLLTLVCSGLARDFSTFAVTQVVVAATSRSAFVLYVILYEVTTPSRRILYCTAAPALSTIIVPIFVFLVDTFKLSWYWSQLIVAALSSVLLAAFCVLEESPVWLLEMHNAEQAERVVVSAASVNAISPSRSRDLFRRRLLSMDQTQNATTRGHTASLIAVPELRKRSVVLAFTWVVLSAARGHYAEERGIPVSSHE
ncbi:beta-alanine transporter-like [Haemaphysalis longicornis]